jgi:parallel beta-helix repeat protein
MIGLMSFRAINRGVGPNRRSSALSSCFVAVVIHMCVASTSAVARTGATASSANCAIVPTIPKLPLSAKIFSRGAAGDDSAAIQDALDQLKAGDWLIFPPGTYRITKTLVVRNDGVTLYGRAATILFTDATQGGLMVQADNVAIYGFRLDQASTSRQTAPWSGGIAVYDERGGAARRVRGTIIQNNVINNAAAAGIFLYKADGFTVAENTVWRSGADAIHMTAGASNGRIIGNSLSQSGDDMIAVVSYAGSPNVQTSPVRYKDWPALQDELSKNIYIAGNRASDEYWGRGISVVGGSNVTIEKNSVSRIPGAAGIYLERESSYRTFGDHNILVRGNIVSQIQTMPPSYKPSNIKVRLSGHGAIELGSSQDADESSNEIYREAFSVRDIAIVDNTIKHARFSAIRSGVGTRGTVINVLVRGNELSDVGGLDVVETDVGMDTTTAVCRKNKLNGVMWPSRCARTIPPAIKIPLVTGAMLRCARNGILAAE